VAETWPDLQILGYGCDALRWLWWSSKLAERAGLAEGGGERAWASSLDDRPPACEAIRDSMRHDVIAAVLLSCGVEPT